MEASNKQKRTARRAVLTAESLEGRQLLSGTTATTPPTGTVAVSTPAAEPTAMTLPIRFGRIGRGHFGHFGAGGSHGLMSHAVNAGGQVATPAVSTSNVTSADTSTGTADTSTSTSTAATSSTPMPGPWSRMKGLGWRVSKDGTSTVGQASLASGVQGLPQGGMASVAQYGPALGVQGLAPGGMMLGGGLSGGGSGGMGMGMGRFETRGLGRFEGVGLGGFGNVATAGGSSTSATTNPVVTALKQVKTEEQAIADKSQVTPALQAALRTDLQTLSKAATTAPDSTKVLALQSDLQSLAGTLPTSDQLATLQADFTSVVNSQGVTDSATITKTFTDVNALITATNIGASDITTLTADLKAAGRSTTAPLGRLGIDLNVLDQALNPYAGSTATTTAAAPPTATTTTTAAATSGSTTTTTTS
jgi:hypothetical protein